LDAILSYPFWIRRDISPHMSYRALLLLALLANPMLQGKSKQDEKPYKIGPDVSAPRVLSKVDPTWTCEAPGNHCGGDVLIELVVTRDGKASDVHEIGKRVGCGLDESAILAVQKWTFKPGEKNGRPVPVIAQITVTCHLPH
jgi:TonB family protein